MKIGFAGLGIMGAPMSQNLLKTGFDVIVWNRTSSKTKPLQKAGARVASSLPDLARFADVLITMLNDTPDVEEIILGPDGLARALTPGKIIIDMSTISPDATTKIAARLEQMGCAMLDAPVSGGDIGAQKGTLTIMVGGPEETFTTCLPVFQALGKNIVLCGGHGDGQRVKMINQVLCGLHAVALSEAFILAQKMELDLEVVHQVVSSGAAGSWALDNYGPRILCGDFSPGFKLGMQQKDLRIAHETADKLQLQVEGAELAFRLFTRGTENGLGELGSHALIKLYDKNFPSQK